MKNNKQYPLIDLFAGPGGLGEGFASRTGENDESRFYSLVSIECDPFSHKTLLLRHFFRLFLPGEVPEAYYDYLHGDIRIEDLYQQHEIQYHKADKSALRIALGKETHNQVRKIISERLAGRQKWALVGGPPCQAYSLAGRSRMMGNPDFEKDERHFLYREYLKIIIDHRPPVFVMENVKGLLSARIDDQPVIWRIISDLTAPRAALDSSISDLDYRLYSLSEDELPDKNIDPRLFLVKAEEFGVPQARHRMFIVGVRSDISVRPRRLRRHPSPTVEDTIGHLPAIRSGLSRSKDSPEAWRREIVALATIDNLRRQLNSVEYADAIINRIKLHTSSVHDYPFECSSARYSEQATKQNHVLTFMRDRRLYSLNAHEARSHMASDLRRHMYAATFAEVTKRSPKLSDFPESLLPDHRNVDLGTSGKMFSDRFRVQLSHQVATTITSHISKDGHYFISINLVKTTVFRR